MSWRRWKLGVAVAVVMSLIVAGAGLVAGMHWQAFVAVFCAASATHLGTFLKDHPVEKINFNGDTEVITRPEPPAEQKTQQ